MKNLLIILLLLFFSCSKKETENINVYQITVRYLGSQDAPHPIIILANRKPDKNCFPNVNYQIEKDDLMKIEKISYSKIREYNQDCLVLVEVNKDNRIEKYFFRKKDGIKILNKIQKKISHYNNQSLDGDLLDLQLATKQNWYRDGKIIGL